MAIIFSNNASSNLQEVFTSESNTIIISKEDIGNFPYTTEEDDNYFFVVVQSKDAFEVCKCVEVNLKNGTLTVERAQEGTTAVLFNKGSLVEHRLTAGSFKELAKIASDSFSHALSDVSKIGQADSTNYGHVKFVDSIDFNNFTDIGPKSESGLVVSPDIFSRYAQELRDFVNGPNAKQFLTTSGVWTAPFTCKYRIYVVGGGGEGGASGKPKGIRGQDGVVVVHTGAGGGGGSAGMTNIVTRAFVKGTQVPYTVGGISGTSTFGEYASSAGGGAGGKGGDVYNFRVTYYNVHVATLACLGYGYVDDNGYGPCTRYPHYLLFPHVQYIYPQSANWDTMETLTSYPGGAHGKPVYPGTIAPTAGTGGWVSEWHGQFHPPWSVGGGPGGVGGKSLLSHSVRPDVSYGNGGAGTPGATLNLHGYNSHGMFVIKWDIYPTYIAPTTTAQPGVIYIEAIID